MKYLLCMFTILTASFAITADELMHVHRVTATEMSNIVNPQAGSLVYNTSDNNLFFYTGSVWKVMKANGLETIVTAGSNITTTGNGTASTPYIIGK